MDNTTNTTNTTPDPVDNRDQIEQALHRARVHDGFPPQRRALAVALDVHGIQAADIDLLAEGIAAQRRKDSDGVPAILAKLLADPKTAKARIEDMQRGQRLRVQVASAKDEYPGKAYWKAGTDDGWSGPDLARNRRVAYAIIVADAKPATEAASVLGCSPEQANLWATEHAELVRSSTPQAERPKVARRASR